MKTKKIEKKLTLNKTTIENLGKEESKAIQGGFETNRLGLACMGDPYDTDEASICANICTSLQTRWDLPCVVCI